MKIIEQGWLREGVVSISGLLRDGQTHHLFNRPKLAEIFRDPTDLGKAVNLTRSKRAILLEVKNREQRFAELPW